MCTPKIPDTKPLPERQPLQLPDKGASANRVDEEARRRRALMPTAYAGSLGNSAGPSVTTALGA